jgi:hypothetical protein
VAASSSIDVWAVGWAHIAELNGYDADEVVVHWDGNGWSFVTPPYPGGGALSTVSADAGQVWTAGYDVYQFRDEDGTGSFVWLRSGAGWAETATSQRLVKGVAGDGNGGAWLVGYRGSGIDESGNGFPISAAPLIERYACS